MKGRIIVVLLPSLYIFHAVLLLGQVRITQGAVAMLRIMPRLIHIPIVTHMGTATSIRTDMRTERMIAGVS